jgi:hypothetical protein
MACSSSIFRDGFYADFIFIDQVLVRRLSNFWPETPADIRPYDFLPMKTEPQM